MKHTRTWQRLFAAAVAVTMIGAVAPVATADEKVPAAESAVAPIEPLAEGQELSEETRQPFATAVANGLPDAEWEYFRTVNVTRLQNSVDPSSGTARSTRSPPPGR